MLLVQSGRLVWSTIGKIGPTVEKWPKEWWDIGWVVIGVIDQ